MDWILPASHDDAAALRREMRDHLTRHARPGEDVDGAVLAFSEILTNAVEHAGTTIWVSLDWGSRWPVVTVHDIGGGVRLDESRGRPDARQANGRGLMIATAMSRELRARLKSEGGTAMSIVFDVERDVSDDIDPDPSPTRLGLPRLDEAEAGHFGREPFLKALAVEVAQAVESEHGPGVAEKTVATVGASVGRQMETAFRAEHGLTDQLTTGQVADLYVGLKSAIGGTFEVVEMDDEKIVLENGHCPFGDAVREAPSLCRMTSSVFGGIAARNGASDVAVHLEERIAVGDSQCRVVVYLTPPPSEAEVFVHRYGSRSGQLSSS